MKSRRQRTFFIFLSVSLGIVVVTVTSVARKRVVSSGAIHKQQEERVTDVLPPVHSSLRGIDVVSASIDKSGTAIIVVANNTDKAVRSLVISAGNRKFSDDNGLRENNLPPLIPPHSTYTFLVPVSSLRVGIPLRISAVSYDDDSEEGDQDARAFVHNTREQQRRQRLQEPDRKD